MDAVLEFKDKVLAVLAANPSLAVPLLTFVVVMVRQPMGLRRAVIIAIIASVTNAPIPHEYKMGVALFALLPGPKRSADAGAVDRSRLVKSKHHAKHRARLVAFYEAHAPEKVGDVDKILAEYFGREDVLFARLENKYLGDVAAQPAADEHLPSPEKKKKAPAKAKAKTPAKAKAPAAAPSSVSKAKEDARAAMEARLNARLAKKK